MNRMDKAFKAVRSLLTFGKRQPANSINSTFFAPSAAGIHVTDESALRYATVHACVRVLAEDVAALPLHVYQRTEDGGKERVREHPLYALLHDQPNTDMTASSMREAMMVSLLLTGNAYAFIEYARNGTVKALWPLLPSETQPYRTKTGELRYRCNGDDLPANEVLHIPGLSFDGLLGLSPIAYAREAVGLGLAAERFGSQFFRDGTHLGGVVTVPTGLSDEAFERTRVQFNEMYRGMQRTHSVAVLEGGASYVPFGIPPEDAQFLETRKFQRNEIAAIYRVPPHLIGDLERATFSNIEHQDLAYLQRTLLPWLVRWEQACRMRLLNEREKETLLIEHDTSGFLRGDTKSRMEAYSIAINSGIMTQNEARRRENLNPVQGGDVLRYPLNMGMVGDMAGIQRTLPLPSEAEKRSTDENASALAFTGVTGAQYRALTAAIMKWQKADGEAVLALIAKHLNVRSIAEDGYGLLGKIKSYYADLAAYVPNDIRKAIDDIANAAYMEAAAQLGRDVPPREWFEGRLKYFYGDEMERLKHVNAAEIESVIRSAIGQNKGLWGVLNQRISGWGDERAASIAKTEAAFTQNKMLIRTIRKAGYLAVWHTAPGCCALCRKMDGVVVTTLSPPLHPGCCCTVRKGKKNEGYNDPHPESDQIIIPSARLAHSAYGKFKQNGRMIGGGHLWSVHTKLVAQGIDCPIVVENPNGVKFGSIGNHSNKNKREYGKQAWFPESWTEETLEKAAKYVYTTGEQVESNGYGRALEGNYCGVNVRINILPIGEIHNINPSYDQPQKGEEYE